MKYRYNIIENMDIFKLQFVVTFFFLILYVHFIIGNIFEISVNSIPIRRCFENQTLHLNCKMIKLRLQGIIRACHLPILKSIIN